jgi:DNA-binding LacI/PurR family transcriptional regulator
MQTPLSGKLINGVVNWGLSRNINAMFTHLSPGMTLPPCIMRKEVSGIIARTSRSLPRLQQQMPNLPLVVAFETEFHMSLIKADFVQPDNRMVAELALKEFQDLGCSRMMSLEINKKSSIRDRMNEFKMICKNSGMPLEYSESDPEQIMAFAQRVKAAQSLVGIFLPVGDRLFYQLLRALENIDLTIGIDFHIVPCCDDPESIWDFDPSITCIDICADQIGMKAAEVLMHRLENPNSPSQRVLVRPMLRKNSI